MTDKEQIMINGIDISGCEYACNTAFGKKGCKHPMMKNIYCSENPNCYFKQLTRKIQEYEELKEELETYKRILNNPEYRIALTDIRTGDCDIQEQYNKRLIKKNDQYRKTLEDVERTVRNEMCDTLGRLCVYCDGKNSCITFKILNIINKAKGE